jgi:hypothetical protein
LLVASDVEQQIDHAELIGDADLPFGLRPRSSAETR